MSNMKSCVALSISGNKTVCAESITDLAKKMGTSRTNISDVINEREGRTLFKDKNGLEWVVA